MKLRGFGDERLEGMKFSFPHEDPEVLSHSMEAGLTLNRFLSSCVGGLDLSHAPKVDLRNS